MKFHTCNEMELEKKRALEDDLDDGDFHIEITNRPILSWDYDDYECSGGYFVINYCPFCGAKLDE